MKQPIYVKYSMNTFQQLEKTAESIQVFDISEKFATQHFFMRTTDTEIENIIMLFKSKKCDISTYPTEAFQLSDAIYLPSLVK